MHLGPYTPNHSFTENVSTHWLANSGATSHMTNIPGVIQNLIAHVRNNQVYVGNGNSLPIKNTGDGILPTPSSSLLLKNILQVLGIKENVLSVAKFTCDNNCVFLLFPWGYVIKDLRTWKTLMEGPVKGNLYPIPIAHGGLSGFANKVSKNKEVAAVCSNADSKTLWHRRLGHPSSLVMSKLPLDKKFPKCVTSSICEAYQIGKNRKLPFPLSIRTSSVIFYLIHCDIWGPSPQSSVFGFRYYIP